MNLYSLRVLNTRPKNMGIALTQAINAAGGRAISCPTLKILPTATTRWLPNLPLFTNIQYAIFTSINAAHYFFSSLKNNSISWPQHIIVIAIGKATAKTLEKNKVLVHFVPTIADSEHLLALPVLQHLKNCNILLIKGYGGRTLIAETLVDRGANLTNVNVYRRFMPKLNNNALARLWLHDAIDIIIFTSQEAMQNLFILLGAPAKNWLQQKPCLVISPRLAQEAANMGIKNIITCTPDTILDALNDYCLNKKDN